jgi:hypothetical protein
MSKRNSGTRIHCRQRSQTMHRPISPAMLDLLSLIGIELEMFMVEPSADCVRRKP